MDTILIGMKDFRQNLAGYTKRASKGDVRYIILKKNVPVLEVKAVDEKKFLYEKLKKEIAEAREDVKEGRLISQEDMLKKYGLL